MYLSDRDVAQIRSPVGGEAQPAFRISYPATTTAAPRVIEVLAFEGELWWPLCIRPPNFWLPQSAQKDNYPHKHATKADLLAELATNQADVLHLRPASRWDLPTIEAIRPRSVKSNERDEALAQAHRKLWDNVILVEEHAFARGGEPVYVRCVGGPANIPQPEAKSSVAALGPDREVHPSRNGLREPPGRYAIAQVQDALWRGNFYRADQYDAALADLGGEQKPPTMGRIEILMPEMVQAASWEVQLDALFRAAVLQMARLYPRAKWPEIMQSVEGSPANLDSTSRERFDALVEFATFTTECKASVDFQRQIVDIATTFNSVRSKIASHLSPIFDSEDEKALLSLV
jgi:hypothetical protein